MAAPRSGVPVNILFIENSIGLSGSTMSLCALLNYLDPDIFEAHMVLSRHEQEAFLLGHLRRPGDLTVITSRHSLRHARVFRRILEALGAGRPRLTRLVLRFVALLDIFNVKIPYALRLYRYAKERRITLIHQNNGFDEGALILSKLLRVPLVAYQRGDEWNSATVRWLARYVRRYIANSVATQKNLLSLGIPAKKISVVYPPLDLMTFDIRRTSSIGRKKFGLDDSNPCFGILGLLLPWKGHRVFLKAAKRVIDRVPDARAFVIGAPPRGGEEYAHELRALAGELGIERQVIFTGFRSDVADLLPLLDVVVHTSIQPEPFGRVIVEAMSMKRPVVASAAGGPLEIIEDGRTGFLVPPGDDATLANRILELLDKPELARRMGEAGYLEVVERFSPQKHARMVAEVYEELLPKPTRTYLKQTIVRRGANR
jgi:glycosyltransferase involved in cell wall biosynthesis